MTPDEEKKKRADALLLQDPAATAAGQLNSAGTVPSSGLSEMWGKVKNFVAPGGFGLYSSQYEMPKPIAPNPTDIRLAAGVQGIPQSLPAEQEAAREVAKTGPATGGVSTPENGATPGYGVTSFTGGMNAAEREADGEKYVANLKAIQALKQQMLDSQNPDALIKPQGDGAITAPVQNLHSGNDEESRRYLDRLRTSASSIVGGRVGLQKMQQAAYLKALEADLAKRGGVNPMAMESMRLASSDSQAQRRLGLEEARSKVDADMARSRFGLDSLRAQQDASLTDARIREANAGIRAKDVQANAAEQIAALQKAYTTTTDETKRKEIERQLQVLSGKYERGNLKDNYLVVPGGKDAMGNDMPGRVFDATNQRFIGEQPKSIATDPRAIAIRDNKSLSTEEKRKQLQALGY